MGILEQYSFWLRNFSPTHSLGRGVFIEIPSHDSIELPSFNIIQMWVCLWKGCGIISLHFCWHNNSLSNMWGKGKSWYLGCLKNAVYSGRVPFLVLNQTPCSVWIAWSGCTRTRSGCTHCTDTRIGCTSTSSGCTSIRSGCTSIGSGCTSTRSGCLCSRSGCPSTGNCGQKLQMISSARFVTKWDPMV